MHKRRALVMAAAAVGAVAVTQSRPAPVSASSGMRYSQFSQIQHRLLSGTAVNAYMLAGGGSDVNFDAGTTTAPRHYMAADTGPGCFGNIGSDVRVAQNCLNITDPALQGRGQAQNETAIAADPANQRRMVASWNDYRRGDGNCYGSYSRDGGASWTDTTVPMGFTYGTNFGGAAREYWQAGGDTSVAWDTQGNAYLMCQVFNRGGAVSPNPDLSSAFYLFRSTRNGGASWDFPGHPVAESPDTTGTGTQPFLDKEYMTVDNHTASPYRDRIYTTWTTFAPDGSAYIYEAYSDDYGQTFSSPVVVSGNNSTLCTQTYGAGTAHGNCNENQFSDPFTAADGSLYVAFANYNNTVTGSDNRNQMLIARSTDGGQTFSTPVKVSDYYDLPDCATYQGGQDAGRACVPEKGPGHNSVFRATNYPSGSVDPATGAVSVTFGSYINPTDATACTPNGFSPYGINLYNGVKSTCQNKIMVSTSTDHGASFSSTDPTTGTMVSQAASQRTSDQWFQWAAYTSAGKLAVSYYDRSYGRDETTGYSDFSLSASSDGTHFSLQRATTSSSPPPTAFSGLFWGDYTGIAVTGNTAHPIWSDTRDRDLFLCPGTGMPGVPPKLCLGSATNASVANAEETYTRAMTLP